MSSDIIRWVIDWMVTNEQAVTEDLALRCERAARAEWGGQEVGYVRKTCAADRQAGRRPLSPDAAGEVYAAGLSASDTEEVVRAHGVSRATLYRLMKRHTPTER
jgi:DNA invertase Pin-like site-specific DNA recombinase